jgi:hypothetical protein
MTTNEWSTPEQTDDRTQRLIDAMPDEPILGESDTPTGRLTNVLAGRKQRVRLRYDRLHALLEADVRDARWTDQLTDTAGQLCAEAGTIRDIYHVGAGIGTKRARDERRRASNEWHEQTITWARLTDLARATTDEKPSDEAQQTLF